MQLFMLSIALTWNINTG